MKSIKYLNYFIFLILIFAFTFLSFGQNVKKHIGNHQTKAKQITANPTESVIDINNITSWIRDDGHHDWIVGNGSWNGEYPNGSDVGVLFSEGIIWGGKVSDGQTPIVRVNGNIYISGCSAITRLFRVRPDYLTADLTRDAADFFKIPIDSVTENEIQQLRNQYQTDWNEWPANQGAFYVDIDNNGEYNPAIDTPGIPEAAQTIFIKYDDSNSFDAFVSPPIGLDISETYWAYDIGGPSNNLIFKKVDIIYKGTINSTNNSKIDSFYISQWADPDVGNSTDDFAGSDTTLNLGFAYNSTDSDWDYDGVTSAPPAVGYRFMQGVSHYTGNQSDSAIFNLKWRKGYIFDNPKPMTSFTYSIPSTWVPPESSYSEGLKYFNLMRGVLPNFPYPAAIPFPDSIADGSYLLTGDPVSGTGKLDGLLNFTGDRRIFVTNGPIMNFEIGDTAEVVVALVAGQGDSNLNSITQLKNNAQAAKVIFDYLCKYLPEPTDSIPSDDNSVPIKFSLFQNYPNPFNPSTNIKFSIASDELVTLRIYDALGKEISTLINKNMNAGNYETNFNASNLSTGVYIYQLTAGSFISSKKMIFLK